MHAACTLLPILRTLHTLRQNYTKAERGTRTRVNDIAAATASGNPGAAVAVGGGVNGATLELAVLARLNCQRCFRLPTHYRVNWVRSLLRIV